MEGQILKERMGSGGNGDMEDFRRFASIDGKAFASETIEKLDQPGDTNESMPGDGMSAFNTKSSGELTSSAEYDTLPSKALIPVDSYLTSNASPAVGMDSYLMQSHDDLIDNDFSSDSDDMNVFNEIPRSTKDRTESDVSVCVQKLCRIFGCYKETTAEYLEILMDDNELLQIFIQYIERRDEVEEIHFLRAIREYKRNPCQESANRVYSTFVDVGTTFIPLSVSGEISSAIKENEVDVNIFGEIEEILVESLGNDHFESFVSSPEFEEVESIIEFRRKEEQNLFAKNDELFSSVKKKNVKEFKSLMKKGYPITILNKEGDSLLFSAVAANALDIVEVIARDYEDSNLLVDKPNAKGLSALHEAARNGNSKIVEKLCVWGANIDRLDESGKTPLHYAALSNDMRTVGFLVQAGADIEVTAFDGTTVVDLASKKVRANIMELLLDRLIMLNGLEGDELQWSTLFSVNIPLFDEYHKLLFRYLITLSEYVEGKQSSDVLGIIVLALNEYVKFHFAKEEKYMVLYNYPDYRSHRSQHKKFEEKVKRAEKEISSIGMSYGKKLHRFVRSHFLNHVLVSDRMYIDFFANEHFVIE